MAPRRTAVIVGGSSGIGLALAKAMSLRGESVVLTSRDAESQHAVVEGVERGPQQLDG